MSNQQNPNEQVRYLRSRVQTLQIELHATQAELKAARAEIVELKKEVHARKLLAGLNQSLLVCCDELELSTHAEHCLARYNAQYVHHVATRSRQQLVGSGFFTTRALDEIYWALKELELSFQTYIPTEVLEILPEPFKYQGLDTELRVLRCTDVLNGRCYEALCGQSNDPGPKLKTVGQLVQCKPELLLKAKGFGPKSLELVERILKHIFDHELGTVLEPDVAARYPVHPHWTS